MQEQGGADQRVTDQAEGDRPAVQPAPHGGYDGDSGGEGGEHHAEAGRAVRHGDDGEHGHGDDGGEAPGGHVRDLSLIHTDAADD
ncbi:hypothetical protein C1I98_32875 [Spongiactinospora gelatinilytica]|uniref:Uncharacterized protein n=1 Tax=Spongiactinospora gelatinilytica TaxID=2666298 RepID=A0A2W2F0C0_9ACTN|nr:hypothetical protein C1I98_32875 [Spongiactinospora gelatinilytica]